MADLLARMVRLTVIAVMLGGVMVAIALPQVVVSDGFDDGGFDDGSDPMDIDWLEHGPGGITLFMVDDAGGIDSGDALEMDRTGNQPQGARALLPDVLTLDAVGQSINLSFDFRFAEDPPDTNRGLRAGLFDTLGTDGDLIDDHGYFMQLGTGFPLDTPGSNNAPHLSVRQELGLANGIANGADNVGVPNDDPSIFTIGINDQRPHHATLTLTKTDAGVLATADVDSTVYSLEFVPGDELSPGNFAEDFNSFDEVVIHGSKGPFDIRIDNVEISKGTAIAMLQAGDADQDFDFDQLDLVRVQIAAKYLTGQPATWGEGDWDGAPGGSPGSPPVGNGQFDQLDIIAALAPGLYLTGPYAVINAGGQAPVAYQVPEPSSMFLCAIGLLVCLLRPRREKKLRQQTIH